MANNRVTGLPGHVAAASRTDRIRPPRIWGLVACAGLGTRWVSGGWDAAGGRGHSGNAAGAALAPLNAQLKTRVGTAQTGAYPRPKTCIEQQPSREREPQAQRTKSFSERADRSWHLGSDAKCHFAEVSHPVQQACRLV